MTTTTNENLDYLLLPPGKTSQIGAEQGKPLENGIAKFVSPQGSYRYVLYQDGTAVAAMQVMDLGKSGGVVANIFVSPTERRKGLGTKLFDAAKKDFKPLDVSEDLSGAGRAWKGKVLSYYTLAEDDL